MSITAFYVGFGVSIEYGALGKIFLDYDLSRREAENIIESDSLTNDKKHDDGSQRINELRTILEGQVGFHDQDTEYDYDYIYDLENFLKENPIEMSDDGLILQIIAYPHTHYDGTKVAVGVFYEISDNFNSLCNLSEHKKVLNGNFDTTLFQKLFGKNPHYMVIANGCNCCK